MIITAVLAAALENGRMISFKKMNAHKPKIAEHHIQVVGTDVRTVTMLQCRLLHLADMQTATTAAAATATKTAAKVQELVQIRPENHAELPLPLPPPPPAPPFPPPTITHATTNPNATHLNHGMEHTHLPHRNPNLPSQNNGTQRQGLPQTFQKKLRKHLHRHLNVNQIRTEAY